MTISMGRISAVLMMSLLGSIGRAQERGGAPGSFQGLVKVAGSGGLCAYGPCYSEWVIEKNGSYTWSEGNSAGPEIKRRGRIKKKELAQLTALIRTSNFEKIKARKFTDTCPTAYDGQENTYVFNTPGGIETIPSCTYAIDGTLPLFKLTYELLARIQASP